MDTNTGHLHVNGTTYGDAGTYTCIATNEYGSVSVNATISVEGMYFEHAVDRSTLSLHVLMED